MNTVIMDGKSEKLTDESMSLSDKDLLSDSQTSKTNKDSKDTQEQSSIREKGHPGILDHWEEGETTLAKLSSNGLGLPTMTRKEAHNAGLQFYWSGQPCSKGHYAQRRVVNNICVACLYVRNKDRAQVAREERQALSPKPTPKAPVVKKKKESFSFTTGQRETVLKVYAETSSLELAAKAIQLTLAELNVHIARTPSFATQIFALEKRMRAVGEKEKLQVTAPLKWDEEKYDKFIRAYIDSGNIAVARDVVGASASSYFDELETNPDFAERVKKAHPKAAQALEEKAIQLALDGNDKLLGVILKAKLPEYKEKIQVESTNTTFVAVSDSQINNRIQQLLSKHNVIEGEIVGSTRLIEHDPAGSGSTANPLGRVGSKEDSEQAGILLSGGRTP